MAYSGTIRNGVVVFNNGIHLPEGAPVQVVLITPAAPPSSPSAEPDAVFRMSELAVDTGIPDLATNVDHYLYGHPKQSDGQ